jgi:hypothetical protein
MMSYVAKLWTPESEFAATIPANLAKIVGGLPPDWPNLIREHGALNVKIQMPIGLDSKEIPSLVIVVHFTSAKPEEANRIQEE